MASDNQYLPSFYQQYIHRSRYSRFRDDLGRRENWEETIERFVNHMRDSADSFFDGVDSQDPIFDKIEDSVLNTKALPSMRVLMTAGKALEKENISGYNCSFRAIDDPRAFDEILYILMCGTGVGFSVERQFINQLPEIPEDFTPSQTTIVVRDSKLGWAQAFRELISLLYNGRIPNWDMSKVRPAGSRLKTFGGRSSGPEPLERLFQQTVDIFKNAAGRKLNSIECHDLTCSIADIVVVGGVRRAALISMSNLTDERMRNAKNGRWWEENPQRALANNSVAYTENPDMEIFMREWLNLVESKSGERGIFNVNAAKDKFKKINDEAGYERRKWDDSVRCNPCSEILLKNKSFCNLTEVVARKEDGFEDLKDKVRIATIIGTMQASMTNFRHISKDWARNAQEEALLGVSITGIMDNPILANKTEDDLGVVLDDLRKYAVEVNREWAEKIGINPAAAITCVKPSGTASALTNSASGIHARYAPYYLRAVRADNKDPLAQFMIDKGFPYEADQMNPHNYVFYFPIKTPDGAVCTEDRTAIEELEHWSIYNRYWTEHKPSVTINVKEDEWMDVGTWVWNHFSETSGVSFLPYFGHIYAQAPFQPLTKEQYEEWLTKMPNGDEIDWDELSRYETEDNVNDEGAQNLACSAGACEIT